MTVYDDKTQLWWPDPELGNFIKAYDYILKHSKRDVNKVLPYVTDRSTAIQAGGYVGMWALAFRKYFSKVYTFECHQYLYEALKKNVEHDPAIVAIPDAVGESDEVCTFVQAHGGGGYIRATGPARGVVAKHVTVGQKTIDSLELPSCGLIYLDIEGYEPPAIKGAEQTIRKFQPVVVLETPHEKPELYDQMMVDLGYKKVGYASHDAIYVSESSKLCPQ